MLYRDLTMRYKCRNRAVNGPTEDFSKFDFELNTWCMCTVSVAQPHRYYRFIKCYPCFHLQKRRHLSLENFQSFAGRPSRQKNLCNFIIGAKIIKNTIGF